MKPTDKVLFKEKLAQAKIFERQRRQIVEAEKALKAELAQEKKDYIYNLARDFAHDMQDSWVKQDYIQGRYSKKFTKYVTRNGLYLTPEHKAAQVKYLEALENLNTIFAELAANDRDGFAKAVSERATLDVAKLIS